MNPSDSPGKNKNVRRGSSSATLYQPSIYSYKCRGAFFLSSEDHGSEGTCRGLKSRLKLLSDIDPDTREGAIKNFTYMTDYELEEADANSLNQKTKSILVSPALIYKDKSGKASQSQLPEEEIIKRQRWSCYGSTEVEYLVLKDLESEKEHIAAVAPRNVGVSVRKIEADEGSITSIGVGWLNIVVDAGPSFTAEEEEQEARPPAVEEVPPRPSPVTIANAKSSISNFVDFSIKVGEQMKANVSWLGENVQDDFPSRTYEAGKKIYANVPRTFERTVGFMGKLIQRWRDDDDDTGDRD